MDYPIKTTLEEGRYDPGGLRAVTTGTSRPTARKKMTIAGRLENSVYQHGLENSERWEGRYFLKLIRNTQALVK